MIDTKLIMLEGLPGTGKSTNSYFLRNQLEFNGIQAKWIHEVARPHPTLFFDEASFTYEEFHAFIEAYPGTEPILPQIAVFRKNTVGIDLLEIEWNYLSAIGETAYQALQKFDVWTFSRDKYMELAFEKWECFTEKVIGVKDVVYILDSSIFQYQIFSFLLKNVPYVDIKRFVQKLLCIVQPLNPSLIYLFRENTNDIIDTIEKKRGLKFMEGIWERDKLEPYYQDKPIGAEGHKQFLNDYACIARKLYDEVTCSKISIEISKEEWATYESNMLSFLGVERASSPTAILENGTYRNDKMNFELIVSDLLLTDPRGTTRRLTPKSENEFYVECLPTVLRYDGSEQLVVSGEQICEQWTTQGTTFKKVAN